MQQGPIVIAGNDCSATKTHEHQYEVRVNASPDRISYWELWCRQCGVCVPLRNELQRLARMEVEAERLRARFTLPIVCICGSTRFADEHAIARWELEKSGRYICLMINYLPEWFAEQEGWNGHDHFGEAAGVKQQLDELHKRKIDLADSVLVVTDMNNYIGESTRIEIEYAESQHKPVRYIDCGLDALEVLEKGGE